jgi:hypothetical protein
MEKTAMFFNDFNIFLVLIVKEYEPLQLIQNIVEGANYSSFNLLNWAIWLKKFFRRVCIQTLNQIR